MCRWFCDLSKSKKEEPKSSGALPELFYDQSNLCPAEIFLARADLKVVFGDAEVNLAVKADAGLGADGVALQGEGKFLLVHRGGCQQGDVDSLKKPRRRIGHRLHDALPRLGLVRDTLRLSVADGDD